MMNISNAFKVVLSSVLLSSCIGVSYANGTQYSEHDSLKEARMKAYVIQEHYDALQRISDILVQTDEDTNPKTCRKFMEQYENDLMPIVYYNTQYGVIIGGLRRTSQLYADKVASRCKSLQKRPMR